MPKLFTQVAAFEKRRPWQIVRTSFRLFEVVEVPGFYVFLNIVGRDLVPLGVVRPQDPRPHIAQHGRRFWVLLFRLLVAVNLLHSRVRRILALIILDMGRIPP